MRRPTYKGPDWKKRFSNPVVCGRRFCARCGHWRHVVDFEVHRRLPSGAPLYFQSECRGCNRKRQRGHERPRDYSKTDPQVLWQRRYERLKADPVRYELHKEYQRIYREVKRREAGVKPRKVVRSELNPSAATGLPIEPFRVWLDEFFERERVETRTDRNTDSASAAAYEQLATVLDRDIRAVHRAVHRWRKESQVIPLDYADRILTTLDSPARLYELWPELAEERTPVSARGGGADA